MKKTFVHAVMISAAAITIAGCQKTKEQFDFSKKPPDEFAVVKRAPLEMPPDFSLPAPKPGAPRPQELSATDMARSAVLGEDAIKQTASQNGVSQGEAVLLQRTGAANASPAIRAKVDAETAEIIKDETPGIDKLKKWVGENPAEPATEVVDPVAEANRIKQNKAQGRPVTYGKTPEIEE
jgi:hypothetical protein